VQKNTLKEKIKAGKAVIGPIIGFRSPQVVEICGHIGFAFVFIDCEHGAISIEGCEEVVRAAELTAIPTIVRVPENNEKVILRYLDCGANGIQVPHVKTKADAVAAVEAVKYSPAGKRGVAGGRWSDYGFDTPLAESMKYANEQTLVSAMIEDIEAVENLDDIISVDGIDILAIGPADLSASMGMPAEVSNPRVQKTIDEIVKRGNAGGKTVGVGGNSDLQGVQRNLARGARYITIGLSGFIGAACRDLLKNVRKG